MPASQRTTQKSKALKALCPPYFLFASLALIVTAAARSGALQPLLPAGRVQVGRVASQFKIRSMQQGFKHPEFVEVYEGAMMTPNQFKFEWPTARIGGYKTPDGTYYVNEGNTRMQAALQILAKTGNDGPVKNLLEFRRWTQVTSPPSANYSWSALAESLNPATWIISPAWGAIEDIWNTFSS